MFKCHRTAIEITDDTLLDVYPCKICKNVLHQYFNIQRLYQAIDNLDILRVKTLLNTEYTDLESIEQGIEQDYDEFCNDRSLELLELFTKKAINGIMTIQGIFTYNFNDKTDVRPPLFESTTSIDQFSNLTTNVYIYKLPEQKFESLKITETVGTLEAYQLNIRKKYLNHKLPDMLTYMTNKLMISNQTMSYYNIKQKLINPEITKFLELIEVISSRFPILITNELINSANYFNAELLVDLYTKYYISNENACFICYSSHTAELLQLHRFCGHCKLLVHLKCLIKCIQSNGNKCPVCKTRITTGIHRPSNRLYFPEANIYPAPLSSYYLILADTEINLHLHYAIAFLCVKRVEQLLSTISDENWRNYKATADKYALHDRYVYKLKDMPYTNLSRTMYNNDFKAIEDMLLLKNNI